MTKDEIAVISAEANIDIVLIDADILRFELGVLTERHPFLPDVQMPLGVNLLTKNVIERIEGIIKATGAKEYILYFTGPNNFRKEIAKQVPYKGNRAKVSRPANWQLVEDIIRANYSNIITANGQEADDLIALECKRQQELGRTPCIASRDKDLDTRMGWHYRWRCGEYQEEKMYFVTDWQAKQFFYKQLLIGDSTDHILGCAYQKKIIGKSGVRKGVGYVKKFGVWGSDQILEDCTTEKELYEAVHTAYVKKFSKFEADSILLENARLLYIGQMGLADLYNFPDFSEEPAV